MSATDDSRLVHRHVGERALAGDVTQRPYPRGRPQAIVHRDGAQGLVDAHRADADPARSVRRPVATSSASPVSSPPPSTVTVKRSPVMSDPGGMLADVHADALPAEHLRQQVPGLGLLQRQQLTRALDRP